MIDIRPFASLGAANHGWLDAHHHFSFADYHDPARMNWGLIRVWNDDAIAAGTGFAPHSHRDMEIITYVRTGAITHKDSLGNAGRTAAGDVQVMGAGSGVTHSEYNLEDVETTLFQIWVHPREPGGAPHWGERSFPKANRAGGWSVLASGYGDDGALVINADARLLAATLSTGQEITLILKKETVAYLVPAKGNILINDVVVNARDGVGLEGGETYAIQATQDCELVVIESLAV